jgi:hypothetical protein
MTIPKLGSLLPFALPFLLACGGSGSNTTQPTAAVTKAIPADEAMAATWGFLSLEQGTSMASQMPTFTQAGDARVLTTAETASCITQVTSTKGGITFVLYTYSNCRPQVSFEDMPTLNGSLSISFSNQLPSLYTVEYKNLVVTRGTQTWTFNGIKTINVDFQKKQANLTAANLSAVFTDSAHTESNRSYLYNANLNADWFTANTYKLTGSYTLVTNTNTTGGMIAAATPLTWSTGCCYPTSGSIVFTKDTATAAAAFALPCGTLTLTPAGQVPQTQLLPACIQ